MIVLENATKFYKTKHGKKYILKNVTMTIPSETNIGILGRNGTGKPTLLRMLGGIDFPNSGKIYSDKSFSWPMGLSGGFTDIADTKHILIIKQTGKVITYNFDEFFRKSVIISSGDFILVLGKPNSENLQITQDITQIIYQIAVSAGVALRLF